MPSSTAFRPTCALLLLAGLLHASAALAVDPPPADLKSVIPPTLVIPPAPHLATEESLKSFQLEKGFRIACCVSEPEVVKPVQIAFDEDGRMWVVEMRGFMPDVKGTGEDVPRGRISVHEDKDGDGAYETHSVFMDNLLLPRAIAFGHGGVLISEHQKLLWVPQKDGRATGMTQVVDANYAAGGNVEHRASGLVQGLDGAYYSTYSNKAYIQTKDGWGIFPSEKRGQFGMSQDEFGRLVSNNNSLPAQLCLLPPYFHGYNEAAKVGTPSAQTDVAVFPIRVTPGTNRAYVEKHGDVSRPGWKLQKATATCGPLWYTGGLPEFAGKLFVQEPAGNLMMAYSVAQSRDKNNAPTLKTVNPGRAFLASTDERFRPVGASIGPDGCVYVVDFDSGIIQHKAYVSTYLADQIKSRNLEDEGPGAGYGRIWRIAPEKGAPARLPRLGEANTAQLVAHLSDANKWWRDTAGRLLVERRDEAAIPLLKDMAKKGKPVARAHALWALHRLEALDAATLSAAFMPQEDALGIACCRLLADFQGTPRAKAAGQALEGWMKSAKNPSTHLKAAFAFAAAAVGKEAAPTAFTQSIKETKNALARSLFVAGSAGQESAIRTALPKDAPAELVKALDGAAQKRAALKTPAAPGTPRMLEIKVFDAQVVETFKPGEKAFSEICGACHGEQGEGLDGIAPPLAGSEWVNGPKSHLITAVLNGMEGPISVAGKRYRLPMNMPGFIDNPAMDDAQLAAILTYIRSNFGNRSGEVKPGEVAAIRKRLPGRPDPMTPEEVRALPLGEGETPPEELAVVDDTPMTQSVLGGIAAVIGMAALILGSLVGAMVCWKWKKLP